ncbi:MAG TPA: cobalt transporter CbiM [Terriglobales bacterium]|nr:cobalt transporter CbiM [Terriglobales bacterium]
MIRVNRPRVLAGWNHLALEEENPVEIDEIMHIPDGYLSPSTCATLYLFAASGWYAALKRIKQLLATRAIPLISVFAAFSFVVMMFNVPLPGGTTGHAIGVGVAAIVLGPWGSILAISIALAIQALFFGDGGITTLGANCFNMAMVGSFTAYGVYRMVAANSKLNSRQRVFAAAVAGYVAINTAALVTAVELGLQPMLFHDASGTPLYAPYPLHVAIPAMMIGHLTFAGLAEAVISAGMVSYLQRSDMGLLRGVSGLAQTPGTIIPGASLERSQQRLWWAVALLMLFTPLGILAAGAAWGEWSSADLMNPQTREQIAAASGNNAPPSSVPVGIEKLSNLWTAPFPGYAPRFIRSSVFGYLLSAMFGVGVLVLASLLARAVGRKWQGGSLRS